MKTRAEPLARAKRALEPIPGNPGRFSSASSFSPPPGDRILPADRIGGYYIDFSAKAYEPSWPPAWLRSREEQLHVSTAQWGLGAYERFLRERDERWLEAATAAGEHLLEQQTEGGPLDGGWTHLHPMPHTYVIEPPWLSAMAQGEGASLLVRLYLAHGEDRYAAAASRALGPMRVPVAAGGVRTTLDGNPYLEEYPTDPASFVLNGTIFALWGLRDVAVGLGDGEVAAEYESAVAALAGSMHHYDVGFWSRYDLYPHRIPNIASGAYHLLHINQLKAMQTVSPHPQFATAITRFERYAGSRMNRARAFAQKVAFRLLVPRNKLLARRALGAK